MNPKVAVFVIALILGLGFLSVARRSMLGQSPSPSPAPTMTRAERLRSVASPTPVVAMNRWSLASVGGISASATMMPPVPSRAIVRSSGVGYSRLCRDAMAHAPSVLQAFFNARCGESSATSGWIDSSTPLPMPRRRGA